MRGCQCQLCAHAMLMLTRPGCDGLLDGKAKSFGVANSFADERGVEIARRTHDEEM